MPKLKYLICPNCKVFSPSCYSFGGKMAPGSAHLTCSICKEENIVPIKFKEVPYPTIIFPDGKIVENCNEEFENFYEGESYPYGVNVDIEYYEESNYKNQTRCNITEIHHLFKRISPEHQPEAIAFESDLHSHGGYQEVSHIKSIKIIKANKMEEHYYS